ncbi:MAG: enoyl-CoA hydratase-related protein [Paracoccaceae bacterium]
MLDAWPTDWTPDRTFAEARIGLSIRDDIGVLAFQIPDKMNALDEPATAGMAEALEEAAGRVRALIVTGVGGRAFVSGANIAGFDEGPKNHGDTFIERQALLRNFPAPTIAVIRGYCLGGGLMTALNCDFRLAGTDASFGVPAAKLGIAYGIDGLERLVEAIGPARARRLLYVGDRIDAETAFTWGLVEHLYAPDALWSAATAMAGVIAANAPLSIEATKLTVAQITRDPAARDLAAVDEAGRRCKGSADFSEGRAAFYEKRAPRFRGE